MSGKARDTRRGIITLRYVPQNALKGKLFEQLARPGCHSDFWAMWNEPYLETCCRAALHRLLLAGLTGRPEGTKDESCLRRVARMGLAGRHEEGRYMLTETGFERHKTEVVARHAPHSVRATTKQSAVIALST